MVRLMPLLTMQINAQNSPFDMTNRAAQYLMQHFDDPTLTLDTAAAALGISRFALSRLFTGQLELSFSQYAGGARQRAAGIAEAVYFADRAGMWIQHAPQL